MWGDPVENAKTRLFDMATARGRSRVVVQQKIAFLREAVREAVHAEQPRGQYAPSKASRLADLETDTILDTMLVWAAAIYPAAKQQPIKYGRGRPAKNDPRVVSANKPTRGHPRATAHFIAGQVFIEQWSKYFPECGRGRGAKGRAKLRDAAAECFLSLLDIAHSNPRNLLIKRKTPLIDELPSN